MINFDVFNGDADGICALQQLRLANPIQSELITGVKRDISLLKRLTVSPEDSITVLDISLDKNRDALLAILDTGGKVSYFDHHFADDVPSHNNLNSHIDTSADTCTSLIVNHFLNNAHAAWAVVGAFGDNFDKRALSLAESLSYSTDDLEKLKQLGICLNYNGYGATLDDLHFYPDKLYLALHPYADPIDFINESEAFKKLSEGYKEDMASAAALKPELENSAQAVYILPSDAWARRVSGVFANDLAQATPDRAHAMLTRLNEGGYVVSVRAPFKNKSGADDLCRQFETGGGRKAAAGINLLPDDQFDLFVERFKNAYPE